MDRLLDPATHAGVLARYGDSWLGHLPRIVAVELARLGLEVVRPLPGGRTACVLRVERARAALVLKLTPDMGRSVREEQAVARLSQAGAGPSLLEVWTSQYAGVPYHGMLLQLVGDGGSVRDRPETCPPAAVLAHLLAVLDECGSRALEASLGPATSHVRKGLERGTGGGLHGTPAPTSAELETATAELAALDATLPQHWVHGTLHPGNLVLDEDGRLYAIDPRPFTADRHYDIAELALKLGSERAGRNHNVDDGLRLLEELGSELEFDQDRAERWLRAIAASGV